VELFQKIFGCVQRYHFYGTIIIGRDKGEHFNKIFTGGTTKFSKIFLPISREKLNLLKAEDFYVA